MQTLIEQVQLMTALVLEKLEKGLLDEAELWLERRVSMLESLEAALQANPQLSQTEQQSLIKLKSMDDRICSLATDHRAQIAKEIRFLSKLKPNIKSESLIAKA